MSFDNRGQVSLWKNDTGSDKAPVLSGKVVAHRAIAEGETLDISLWKNESDHPQAPVLKGKMGDVYKKPDNGYPQQESRQQSQGYRNTENPDPFEKAGPDVGDGDNMPF